MARRKKRITIGTVIKLIGLVTSFILALTGLIAALKPEQPRVINNYYEHITIIQRKNQ